MSASSEAKKAGCKSLAQVSEFCGKSPQTLNNWYNSKGQKIDNSKLFYIIINKCAELKGSYIYD